MTQLNLLREKLALNSIQEKDQYLIKGGGGGGGGIPPDLEGFSIAI